MSFGGNIASMPIPGGRITDPHTDREYVYTGPNSFTPKVPSALSTQFDDVTRSFGHKTYEDMLTDPTVYSQYLSLKLGIIAGAVRVLPGVRPEGYRAGEAFRPRDGAKLTARERRSIEISSFIERDICRPRHSFKSMLLKGLDMMVHGNKLAEVNRSEVKAGPDRGKLGLASIKVKPHWSWQFAVDATMEPAAILTYVPPGLPGGQPSGYALIPINKFLLFTWLPVDNDPRGTSALRAVYDWWNLKRQVMPFYYQHLRRFGSPSLDLEMSEGDTTDRKPLDPDTGREIDNVPLVSAETRMTQALAAYQNNSIIVRPAGSRLNALEPNNNGESFLKGFDLFDRQICLGIALQTRVSLEAKHGSRADSGTAQDEKGLVPAHAREELAQIITNQLFYESVKLNFGEDAAEEFTPDCMVGATEQQDRAAMITAVTSAGFTIGRSQWEGLDAELGLPERDMEADDAHAREQARQAAPAVGSEPAQDKPTQDKPPQGDPPRGDPPSDQAPKGKAGGRQSDGHQFYPLAGLW